MVQVPLLWTLPACSPRVLVLSLTERTTRPSGKGDGPHQTHVTETNPTRPVPSRPRHVSSPHYLAQLGRANILVAFTSPTRVSASSSVAKTWRTQPSASLARSSLAGVAQAMARLGVPDQRGHAGDGGLGDGPDTCCAWPRAMSRHQKPFAVAVGCGTPRTTRLCLASDGWSFSWSRSYTYSVCDLDER